MGSSSPTKRSSQVATTSGAASSSSALPASISDFTVIPVAYSRQATHILYARRHGGPKHKKDEKGKQKGVPFPEGRTMFLVNVPPDATERELTVLFKSCGTIERVILGHPGATPPGEPTEEDEGSSSEMDEDAEEDGSAEEEDESAPRPKKKRKLAPEQPAAPKIVPLPAPPLRTLRQTGGTAYIIFLDPSSLERALKPPAKPLAWHPDESAPTGLAHYRALYAAMRPPLDVVRAHADSWMEAFEHEQAQRRQESKYRKGEAIVDEDGFTLVTRGGAYGKTLGGGVGVASKKFAAGRGSAGARQGRKRKEKKEKEAFYAFQIHEKKRKGLIDLKRKFEEDQAKIEKLKQSRKFKPY